MNGVWIWKYGDFEKWHGMKYLLAREERGKKIPAFYEIPHYSHSVRFKKKIVLLEQETVKVTADSFFCFWIDGERQNGSDRFTIPAGKHDIMVSVGNDHGMCALKIEGNSLYSDDTWMADGYNGCEEQVGTSSLCNRSENKPGDYEMPESILIPISDVSYKMERIVDFGKETFIKIKLENLPENSCTKIFYGESREELYSSRCTITDRISEKKEILLPARACRYIRFTGNISFKMTAYYQYLPLQDCSYFSGEQLLQQIYGVSKYTLELCSRMFFLDGIKRDRWPWCGDAFITAKMNYYSFFDKEIVKRTLILLRGNRTVVTPPNFILEYSFYWFLMLEDYYLYTGDSDFIVRNYDSAKELLMYYIERVDENGFVPHIPGTWLFVDWHPMTKSGVVCVIQMLYCKAIKCMANFARLCNRIDDFQLFEKLYTELRNKINIFFWDEQEGAFVSAFVNGKKCNEIRRHPNYLAILFDYANDSQRDSILKNVLWNSNIPRITTPFFRFFELDVLCKCGFYKDAFDVIRQYWGGMIKIGATTFWEEFDEDMTGVEHYAMYGEPFDKSLCHAWGAGPIYFIGRYLAGVKAIDVGYKSFEVEPCLSQGNFNVTVPLQNGSIKIDFANGILKVVSSKEGGVLKIKGDVIPLKRNSLKTVKV